MKKSISFLGVLAVQVLLVGLVAASYAALTPDEKTDVQQVLLRRDIPPTVFIPREKPLSVEPLYDDPEVVTDDELAAVLRQLQPRFPAEKRKPNFVEHALRAWSARATFADPRAMSGADMVDFLVNHGSYRKSWGDKADETPLLENRPHGVAIRIGSDSSESVHHDHWLACLTEAGVPLSEPVFAPGRPNGTLNDVLQEALRDFKPDERETEWSAMAFGFWICPQKSWHTTNGREVSFDLLARRLIRGDMRFGVCNGTHRIYSLTVLLRLNESFEILSKEVRDEVWAHLEQVRDLIKVSQFPDGHWPTNWPKGAEAVQNPVDDVNYKKVIATGHHLEWLAIAPQELHPPREQIVRAAKWVISDTVSKSEEEILERYTFYSHVANAMALWRKTHPADFWKEWEKTHPEGEQSAEPALPKLPALPAP